MGLEVVAKGPNRIKIPVMDAGKEAGVQDLVNRSTCSRPRSFFQREGQQAKKCGSTGEGLVNGLRDRILLTSREYKQAVPPVFIREHLQIGQQPRNPLDLIEDRPVSEAGQETARI